MRITLASAMGTCFGVQDAINMALDPDFQNNLTVVGQLVHNPQTVERLRENGVRIIERHEIDSITTDNVMITAHGAADSTKQSLKEKGFAVFDASCPLVVRLHKLARFLERKGYFPVIIGKHDHVEIKGVVGNLKKSLVISDPSEVEQLKTYKRIGVVSQTTNRPEKVQEVLAAIQALPQLDDLRFIDTICKPVKDRQEAISELIECDIDVGIVIGGYNSSNTRKLSTLIEDNNIPSYHIERATEIEEAWFEGKKHVGITAGTSTPQDVIEEVHARICTLSQK